MMQVRLVHPALCRHDGRGPELHPAHYDQRGVQLLAIDYINYDRIGQAKAQHILITGSQVSKFTPEEVANDTSLDWSETGGAAIVGLGKSPWLMSFNLFHLDTCEHFKVRFYHEYLDVICQDIDVRLGRYIQ